MNWHDIKTEIREKLRSRDLAAPHLKLNALESIDRLLDIHCPGVKARPELIMNYPKKELMETLATSKANGRLNAAEKSVINNVYQVVGGVGMSRSSLTRQRAGVSSSGNHVSVVEKSDESYVIDLCDDVLGIAALRQHRFDFLRGDAPLSNVGRRLPVDAYYPSLRLVIEYRERQHTEAVNFFDKPDRLTVSGIHRGEQRRLYDQRRRDVLPQHGIALLEFSYDDFPHDASKRLRRSRSEDLKVVSQRLEGWIS